MNIETKTETNSKTLTETGASRTGGGGSALAVLGGAGFGAALMYFLDPAGGARRRALVRDKVSRAAHRARDAAGATGRDLRNRARGLAAETRARFGGAAASDEVLAARVRAELGRVLSHPRAITVTAQSGRVTLAGPILAREVADLLKCVRAVRGVEDVEDRLEVHDTGEHVPALQGGVERTGDQPEPLQRNWAPATRILAGAAGGALAVYGAQRRGALGTGLGVAGLALVTRGASNIELSRLVGIGGRQGVSVQKTINVGVPVEQAFAFFSDYENFPRFMSHVREVQDLGEGRSHWVVDGPAGVPVEWDAMVTKRVENEVLAWRSLPGSPVENAGVLRFSRQGPGSARVDVKLSYKPPAGAVGAAVSNVLGRDPKQMMDDDLARAKTYLETGTPPRDAAAARRAAPGRVASAAGVSATASPA